SSASLRATDPLLPLIAEDYAVSTGAAAAAVTSFALAYGLLQIVCGPLGDRYGRYRTIAAAASVSALGSLACAAAPDLRSLVLARFVSGATIGAFIPLSLAWIGDTFPYAQRQGVLARFLIGQMVGIGFGAAAAGWLAERYGWRAIFVLLAAPLRRDRARHARRRRAHRGLCAARREPVGHAGGAWPRGDRRRLLHVSHHAADQADAGRAERTRLDRRALRHVSLHGTGERHMARLATRRCGRHRAGIRCLGDRPCGAHSGIS